MMGLKGNEPTLVDKKPTTRMLEEVFSDPSPISSVLVEAGYTKDTSLIENLNVLVFGAIGLLLIGLLIGLLYICEFKCPTLINKIKSKLKVKLLNGIH